MKIVVITEVRKCCLANLQTIRSVMSVPVFLHKLEFVFNKNQSDGCRSQQYLKKRQKLVELYSWHRKIYANEKTLLL